MFFPGMKRVCMFVTTVLAAVVLVVPLPGEVAVPLVRDGTFDLSKNGPSAEYFCSTNSSFDVFVEDLNWNRCGRLSVGNPSLDSGGHSVYSAWVSIGGSATTPGFPVEPDTFYDFSMEVKGCAPVAYLRVIEYFDTPEGERRRRLPVDIQVRPDSEWHRVTGRFRTDGRAKRASLGVELWSRKDFDPAGLKPGDYVMIDNILVEKAVDNDRLFASGRPFAVAVVSPMAEMACPFFPPELVDPPAEIAIRAAVNEQKPMPVAVANLTDRLARYRVVLETVPEGRLYNNSVPDDGRPGLKDFPASNICVREAIPFKDTDSKFVTRRMDPLPRMNEAGVITVPPREAGLAWFDFNTRGVAPADYRGRLRVIPLDQPSKYVFDGKNRRYVRTSAEAFVPVTLTVDPIELPATPVRLAHFCSPAYSEECFALQADIGRPIMQVNIWVLAPSDATNSESRVARYVRNCRRWARARGLEDPLFYVKYSAFMYSQRTGNPRFLPELKWPAWERAVRMVKSVMNGIGVPDAGYIVETWDEPFKKNLPDIIESHRRARAIAPTMQFGMAVSVRDDLDHRALIDAVEKHVDFWTFHDTPLFFNTPFLDSIRRLVAAGKTVGHYQASESATQPLHTYYRRHVWRGEHYGLACDYMYHMLDASQADPAGALSLKVKPSGEFVYRFGDVYVPTVRYMAYREGVTDIKYVEALRRESKGDPAVRAFLEKAATDVVVGDPSSRDLPGRMREEIRRRLLEIHSRKHVKSQTKGKQNHE